MTITAYQARFTETVDGKLVTYFKECVTSSKIRAGEHFQTMARRNGWRLVQCYALKGGERKLFFGLRRAQ